MKNYYEILGVPRTASKEDIKKAYREKAKQHHPDRPGGNADQFKAAGEAYAVLSDDAKRAQYDRFGSAGPTGSPGAEGFGGFDFSGFGFGGQGGDVEFDLGDILGSFFGGARVRRGRDIRVDVEVPFKDAVFGAQRQIRFTRDDGSREDFQFEVPPGTDDGDSFRVPEKGERLEGGRPGNLIVRVRVEPHKTLRREGPHLVADFPVKLSEALLGGARDFEAIDGAIEVKIPDGVAHGEILRVKGKGGVAGRGRGDLYLRVQIQMPKKLSREARKAIESLREEGL
jgi:DnaJ-class molecular chaperone